MKKLAGVVIAFVAACGGKSSSGSETGPDTAATAEVTCEQAAEALGGKMEAHGELTPEGIEATMESFVASCEATGFSAESRQCFFDAPDEAASQACTNGLTDAQRDDMFKRMTNQDGM
jgi:hypothetical protein